MSTIVMRVDLDCDRCYKKIRKLLCKLQDRENIKTISYDEKNNTVTVSGSFDAEEVADRLCSGAGKVITDIQVARGNQMMPGGAKGAPPKHPGKENHGHGQKEAHGHGGGQGQKEGHGYGGGHGQKEGHGYGGGHGQKESHGYGGGHGGGGGKPDKTRHVKFDMDDDEEFDQRASHSHHGKGHGNDQGKGHGHGHGQGHGHPEKPRVFTTTAMSRNEAPRPQQQASMAPMLMPPPGQSMPMMPQGMAPMRMPPPGPSMTMMPQAISTPSIWPAPAAPGPEWGYSAPAYGCGGGPPAGGYYGAAMYDGGYGTYGGGAGAYGRNPYQLQYYEEPSPGCSVM